MLESGFQSDLIADLEDIFPNCIVLKNDPNYLQGFPDLTVLLPTGLYFVLECKRSKDAPLRPNQNYYVNMINGFCYGAIIYPENKGEILNELQRAFKY